MITKSHNPFWRLFLTLLLFPVFGCMSIVPDEGGSPDDDKTGGDGEGKGDGKTGGDGEGKGDGKTGGDGEGKGAGKDDTVSRAELEKVIKARDKAKTQMRELQSQFDEMKNTLGGDPAKIKAQMDEMSEKAKKLQQLEEEAEKKKLADMSELEQLKHQHEKLKGQLGTTQDELEQKLGETTKQYEERMKALQEENSQLKQYKLGSEIMSAAAENNAANPQQIVRLLQGDFKVDDDGEFVVEEEGKRGGINTVSVQDYVKRFLSADENKNLLRPNSGPRKAPDAGDTTTGKDKQGGDKVQLTKEQERDAAIRGMEPKEYYDIVVAPAEIKHKQIADRRKKDSEEGRMLPGQVKM